MPITDETNICKALASIIAGARPKHEPSLEMVERHGIAQLVGSQLGAACDGSLRRKFDESIRRQIARQPHTTVPQL